MTARQVATISIRILSLYALLMTLNAVSSVVQMFLFARTGGAAAAGFAGLEESQRWAMLAHVVVQGGFASTL